MDICGDRVATVEGQDKVVLYTVSTDGGVIMSAEARLDCHEGAYVAVVIVTPDPSVTNSWTVRVAITCLQGLFLYDVSTEAGGQRFTCRPLYFHRSPNSTRYVRPAFGESHVYLSWLCIPDVHERRVVVEATWIPTSGHFRPTLGGTS